MRARLIMTLVLSLLLVSCGDADGVFSTVTTGAGETTSTTGAVTSSTEPPTSTTTTEVATTTEGPTTTTTTTLPAEPVWSRVADDSAVFGGADDQGMMGVVAGGFGVVAVGYDYSGGDGDAAVWASGDGSAWSRAPHDEASLGGAGDQEMATVVVAGPGFVAVGREYSEDSDAAVWTSGDGLAWTRVPHDEGVFGGACHQATWDVVVAGPGLVAVGSDCSHGDRDAAVWVSPDGLTWSRVPHDAAVFGGADDQGMDSVAAGGPGLVAVGYDYSGGDWDAAVWVSSDGLAWSRVAHDEAVFGGPDDQEMASVEVSGSGLVAVGDDYSGGNWDAAVWFSPDGLTWARVPYVGPVFGGAGNQSTWAVTAIGTDLVAVGESGGGDDWDAAVWVRRLAG